MENADYSFVSMEHAKNEYLEEKGRGEKGYVQHKIWRKTF